MIQMNFEEKSDFYKVLDKHVREKESIRISFQAESPGAKSRLWYRLKRCKNWTKFENEMFNKDKDKAKKKKFAGLATPFIILKLREADKKKAKKRKES